MSIQERTWTTGKGVKKSAWVLDYVQGGERHLRGQHPERPASEWPEDLVEAAARAFWDKLSPIRGPISTRKPRASDEATPSRRSTPSTPRARTGSPGERAEQ